jgi:hypothetical protein
MLGEVRPSRDARFGSEGSSEPFDRPFELFVEDFTMASKRELIDTGSDKRYVRRGKRGRFKESDDQWRSLVSDRRRKAKRTVKSGQG